MLIVFALVADLPTVAHVIVVDVPESEEGAGLGFCLGACGTNGAQFGCIETPEVDLEGGAVGNAIGDVGRAPIGLWGRLSERKTLGKRTLFKPRFSKPGSAGLVSIKVSLEA